MDDLDSKWTGKAVRSKAHAPSGHAGSAMREPSCLALSLVTACDPHHESAGITCPLFGVRWLPVAGAPSTGAAIDRCLTWRHRKA
jgi:hypothetical protein